MVGNKRGMNPVHAHRTHLAPGRGVGMGCAMRLNWSVGLGRIARVTAVVYAIFGAVILFGVTTSNGWVSVQDFSISRNGQLYAAKGFTLTDAEREVDIYLKGPNAPIKVGKTDPYSSIAAPIPAWQSSPISVTGPWDDYSRFDWQKAGVAFFFTLVGLLIWYVTFWAIFRAIRWTAKGFLTTVEG